MIHCKETSSKISQIFIWTSLSTGEHHLKLKLVESFYHYFFYCWNRNPLPGSEPFYFKALDSKHFNFFNVTNDGILLEKDPNQDRMEFWNNIFDEFKYLWNTDFNFHLVWSTDPQFQRHLNKLYYIIAVLRKLLIW